MLPEFVEIVDRRTGRRRRARKGDMLADGEVMVTPMVLMDAALPADPDGSPTRVDDAMTKIIDGYASLAGHRPWTPLAATDVSDSAQARNEAYADYIKRLTTAWKRNKRKKKLAPQPQGKFRSRGGAYPVPRASPDGFDDEDDFDSSELSGLTLDELKLRAEQARKDRDQRAANAWRR